jgi:heat shock protein HtpX
MYKARELSEQDAPYVHQLVAELAARAQTPKPRIYLLPEQDLNAFATGRDPKHGGLAVTQGLLRPLSTE